MNEEKNEKIVCPVKQCFKYVAACEASCSRRNRCAALRAFREPSFWPVDLRTTAGG